MGCAMKQRYHTIIKLESTGMYVGWVEEIPDGASSESGTFPPGAGRVAGWVAGIAGGGPTMMSFGGARSGRGTAGVASVVLIGGNRGVPSRPINCCTDVNLGVGICCCTSL